MSLELCVSRLVCVLFPLLQCLRLVVTASLPVAHLIFDLPQLPVTRNARLDSVRADLLGMARPARAVADENPDLCRQFRLPDNARYDALLAAARAQLALLKAPKMGAPLVTLFTDYGMPTDLVADLEADIAAADEANRSRTRTAERVARTRWPSTRRSSAASDHG